MPMCWFRYPIIRSELHSQQGFRIFFMDYVRLSPVTASNPLLTDRCYPYPPLQCKEEI